MASVVKPKSDKLNKCPAGQPRILVVDDEPSLVDVIAEVVRRDVGCKILSASSLKQARQILASQPIELLVTDVNLPDGDGTSLIPALRQHQPHASAIVITGSPSLDGAISAMRGGAVDFVPKPFSNAHLAERIRTALERQAQLARHEKRIAKLRTAVRRLNESRRLISKKVDLLCNDLVSAYGELSRQLDGVRTQEGFRKYVADAKDLEQLLCHAMDWMLRQLGYSNVAVWLTGEDGSFQLGAYMKYTVAGESLLTDAMKRVLLPMAARDGLLRIPGDDLKDKLTPQELALLKGQDVLAVNCTYLGESLAALVFFRDARSPYTDEDEALLKQISPIFAVTLASVVKGGDGDADGPFLEGEGEDGASAGGDTATEEKPKKSDADWWKRGEAPPF